MHFHFLRLDVAGFVEAQHRDAFADGEGQMRSDRDQLGPVGKQVVDAVALGRLAALPGLVEPQRWDVGQPSEHLLDFRLDEPGDPVDVIRRIPVAGTGVPRLAPALSQFPVQGSSVVFERITYFCPEIAALAGQQAREGGPGLRLTSL